MWGDITGTTLTDSTFTLTSPFSIKDSGANNLITIDSDTIDIGSNQTNMKVAGIYDNMSPSGDHRPVYVDSDGQLHTTFSSYVIPMGEIYTEYSVTYGILLTLNTPAQFSMPTGFNSNTNFNSSSWGQIEFTGTYARYAYVNATISCVLASGTNQLLIFELRVNGVKYPAASVKILFNDATQYQTVHLQKLITINPNDILTMWVTNTSGSNNLQVYNFNLSVIISGN